MRTSAYDAPASRAALSASATRSSANVSLGGAGRMPAADKSRGALRAAVAAAPVLRKSRRFGVMWMGREDTRERTATLSLCLEDSPPRGGENVPRDPERLIAR